MGWYCTRCGHEAPAGGACPRDGEPLAPVSTHDLHGRALGEYRVLATLGGGSYGSVYRAIHTRSGMLVALKLLHRPIDDVESKRVMVEARAAAQIDHPNVAKVYDLALTTDRRPYIVMQLLEGKPLAQVIAEAPQQRLALATALGIARDVLAALEAAHARGVIHRDLKPDNIFVTAGRALIVDFGLAKLVADPKAPSLTATGEAIGTPHYMAPEQVRGELADHRADLYAVGCVLFEMLAGRPPFEGGSTYVLFDAHLNQVPVALASLRADVPEAVDRAVSRALAKDARERFGSATELARALAGAPGRARGSRRPLWLLGAGALGVAITVGAVAAHRGGGGDKTATVTAGPREITVPPPLPNDPPLDPKLEDNLRATAEMLTRGLERPALITMRCGITTPLSPHITPALRAYLRRVLAMLDQAAPELDYARDCAAPAPTPKRFEKPGPLPDEGSPDPSFEQAIDAIHEQLETGRFKAADAHAWHCRIRTQTAEAIDRGGLPRGVRGMNRRLDILFEAYYPGSTSASCR